MFLQRTRFSKELSAQKKSPEWGSFLFLDLLVLALNLAPLAILLEFDLASDELLVLARPVVDALASSTGEFYKFVLRHGNISG